MNAGYTFVTIAAQNSTAYSLRNAIWFAKKGIQYEINIITLNVYCVRINIIQFRLSIAIFIILLFFFFFIG